MKKIIRITLLLMSVVAAITSFAFIQGTNPSLYYYAFDKKIPLTVVPNKVFVQFAKGVAQDKAKSVLRGLDKDAGFEWRGRSFAILTTKTTATRQALERNSIALPEVVSSHPVYATKMDDEVGITDEFVVSFLPTVTEEQQKELHAKAGVTVKEKTRLFQVLSVGKSGNTLAVANLYQESGLVTYSHPNFIRRVEQHQVIPNDEFFNRQFGFHNTGQVFTDGHAGTNDADMDVAEAWATTRGRNTITIAVLDDGVFPNHPDLPNARQVRLPNSNFADGDPNDPSPQGDQAHGTHCAGLLAATQGNGEGISGIVPECRIMPVRIFFNDRVNSLSATDLARAITFAKDNGADIISNSWGYRFANDPNEAPAIVQAIRDAVTTGRVVNGVSRGCIVLFSAGNTASHAQGQDDGIRFPASVNIPGVITVGASDRFDRQADYSPTSNPNSAQNQIIDVVAPSHRAYPAPFSAFPNETFEVWSIDPAGNVGDNPWPFEPDPTIRLPIPAVGEQQPGVGNNFNAYSARFGGTSAACPEVAGIAAMILSINSNLSAGQVFDIIANTADHVGGYTYTNGRSNELGYGRVNACQATRFAVFSLGMRSASNFICSTQTFVIPDLPPGLTTTWSTSNPNIATINASTGQATQVGDGSVTIYATVSAGPLSCEPIYYAATVTAGIPSFSNGDIINNDTGQRTYLGAGNTVPENTTVQFPYEDQTTYYFEQIGGGYGYMTRAFDREFDLYMPFYADMLTIRVNKTNPCGTLTQDFQFFPDYYYRYSPNPASNELVVEAVAGKDAKPAVHAPAFDATLYDNYGHKIKTKHSNEGKAVLDVRTLPDGLYNLRVGEGKKAISEHIQITH